MLAGSVPVWQAVRVSTCHVCGSPDFERVLSREDDGLHVDKCNSCGFVYLASWAKSVEKSEELYAYYGALSDADRASCYTPENRARQEVLLSSLGSYTRGRRLLDVGCGAGQLLETAGQEGWDAVGLDLSDSAVLQCQRRGLAASKTDFFSESLDERRFDVIVMSELIEHVPAPQRFLQRAEELLDPGGLLYLTTPNFGSLARRALAESWSVIHPEHIGYFDRSTLRQIASTETGLREIKIEANNLTPSTLVAWMRRKGLGESGAAAEIHRTARQGLDQELRRAVHRSRVLGTSKTLLNHAVSRMGLGDTLVGWFQKPPR